MSKYAQTGLPEYQGHTYSAGKETKGKLDGIISAVSSRMYLMIFELNHVRPERPRTTLIVLSSMTLNKVIMEYLLRKLPPH